MKVARFFAVIFAVMGVVLLLGTAAISLLSINSPVKTKGTPEGAMACSEALAQSVNSGNYSDLEQLLYGQPALNGSGVSANVYAARIWDKFLESMTLTYRGNLYLLDSELARDGEIRVLDVKSVTEGMQARATVLLQKTLEEAQEPETCYDENGNIRGELVDRVLQEALDQALEEDAVYVSYSTTLTMVRRDDRWWVVPDQNFIQAISGLAA